MTGYELLAVRYGSAQLPRSHCFTGCLEDGGQRLDYFFWLARRPGSVVLIDTGFDPAVAAGRGREIHADPILALSALGIEPAEVTDVVLTHLHYDHAGNARRLPNARLHVQEAEMAYATGRRMLEPGLRASYEAREIGAVIEALYERRVAYHDGDAVLFAGLSLHKLGGHTGGLQAVRVATGRGQVVVASDAAHFYRNATDALAFADPADLGASVSAGARLRELAGAAGWWVPGHDPAVMERFEAQSVTGLDCVRLDRPTRDATG